MHWPPRGLARHALVFGIGAKAEIGDGENRIAHLEICDVLAHSLDLEVIGEGVETEMQEAVLLSLRCNVLQGYRFGRPMPSSDFEQLLQQRLSASSDPLLASSSPAIMH